MIAIAGIALGAGLVSYADDDDAQVYEVSNDPKMAAMMKYSTPGPEHGILRQLEGDWDQIVKWRTGPDQPWMHTTGECDNEMVLGGRFLRREVEGKDNDTFKFRAIGYLGYDAYRQRFVSTWMDTMSTMIVTSDGDYNRASRTLTFRGTMPDVATGRNMPFRDVIIFNHKDACTGQMFEIDDRGNEYMSLEIFYKRD